MHLGIADQPTYYGKVTDYNFVSPAETELMELEAFQDYLADMACGERTAREEAELSQALTANGAFRAGVMRVAKVHLRCWRRYYRTFVQLRESQAAPHGLVVGYDGMEN